MSFLELLFARPLGQALGWSLVHFVWQGTAVALALVGILSLLRHSAPSLRYAVACGGLVAMLVIPVVTLRASYAPFPSALSSNLQPFKTGEQLEQPTPATALSSGASAAGREWKRGVSGAFPWLVGSWLAGMLLLSLWRLGGWIYVQYLMRWGGQPASLAWQERLVALIRELGIRRPVRLLESLQVEVPMMIGWLRPVILMPVGLLTGLTVPQVEAVLLHELAHIRRYDYLVNLLQTAAETLLFYHPAVWWVSRRIRQEREYCCDDAAVSVCGSTLIYARTLAALEEWRGCAPQLGMAAGGGSLLLRIRRLAERSGGREGHAAGWRTGMALALALALLLVAVGVPREGHGAAGPASKIAFTSLRDGNFEVYVMNADGTGQTRLTDNPAEDYSESWSPDGEKILFASNRDGNFEVYVMNADGTGQTRLTDNPASDHQAAWSPDGEQIAFYSNREGDADIYVMEVDGSDQTRLTTDPGTDQVPSWSPDGEKILFASDRNGNWDIWVMEADGSNQTRLTANSANESWPSWSPDGTKIAFSSGHDAYNSNSEIYVMEADGTRQLRLTDHPSKDISPRWSPDGEQLAFLSDRDGHLDVYVMEADGSNQRRLITDPASAHLPVWGIARRTSAAQPRLASQNLTEAED